MSIADELILELARLERRAFAAVRRRQAEMQMGEAFDDRLHGGQSGQDARHS